MLVASVPEAEALPNDRAVGNREEVPREDVAEGEAHERIYSFFSSYRHRPLTTTSVLILSTTDSTTKWVLSLVCYTYKRTTYCMLS